MWFVFTQVRRVFGTGDYFEAVGGYGTPPLSLAGSPGGSSTTLTTRIAGTYHRPSLLSGWGSANALNRVAKLGAAVGVFVGALLTVVDVASDIAVAVELVEGGHPRWGIASAVITLLSTLLSVGMLLFERR